MNTIVTVPQETIINQILLIRGKKVMLDRDLADLYQVDTRSLNKAVKRNMSRFPSDFMFRLNPIEVEMLVSQNVIPSRKVLGGSSPFTFTEQGVAMLSSVLNSHRAIQVNIQIIRTFTKLREILADNRKLAQKVELMERKYDKHIFQIFTAIKGLKADKKKSVGIDKPRELIGFRIPRK
jgi:phage regulator Rha-like protein